MRCFSSGSNGGIERTMFGGTADAVTALGSNLGPEGPIHTPVQVLWRLWIPLCSATLAFVTSVLGPVFMGLMDVITGSAGK